MLRDGGTDIVARPYARRIAGIPTAMQCDPGSEEFVFSWRVEPGQQSEISELFVPARHFPAGRDPAGRHIRGPPCGADGPAANLGPGQLHHPRAGQLS